MPALQAPQILFVVTFAVFRDAGVVCKQRVEDAACSPPDAQPSDLQRCQATGITLQQSELSLKWMQSPGIDHHVDAVCGAGLGEPLRYQGFPPDMRGQRRERLVGVEKNFYACRIMAGNHALQQTLMALPGDVGNACFGVGRTGGWTLCKEQAASQFQPAIPISSAKRQSVRVGVGVK